MSNLPSSLPTNEDRIISGHSSSYEVEHPVIIPPPSSSFIDAEIPSTLPTNEAGIKSGHSSSAAIRSEVEHPIIIPLPSSPVIVAKIPTVIQKIPRLPPHYRTRTIHHDVYDPMIVSLGPYHYERPRFKRADVFKQESLDAFVSKSRNTNIHKYFYHGKILERITDIRDCYENDFDFDDEVLAWIILRDACFFIHYLQCFTDGETSTVFLRHFGSARINSIHRDMVLLENQIPFWIIKYLLCLQSDSNEDGKSSWNYLISKRMAQEIYGTMANNPFINEEPFHFLDALLIYRKPHQDLYDKLKDALFRTIVHSNVFMDITTMRTGYNFHSITNLNAKGIRLKVSIGNYIRFTSGTFYGELEVPQMDMTTNGFVLFTNLVAYEINSEKSEFYMTSYINLMKSLIEGPNDVKILREEGVLVGEIGSDDEVFNKFKNLETYNCDMPYMFLELKRAMHKHCRSKAKTWIAELIHTYFRSPWTTIALFTAACLLCLTFIQTFFTIHPIKK